MAKSKKAEPTRLEGTATFPITKAVLFAKVKILANGKPVKMIITADTDEVDGVNDKGSFYLTPKQADRLLVSSGFSTYASLVSSINAVKGRGYSIFVSYREVFAGETWENESTGESGEHIEGFVSTFVEELNVPAKVAQSQADAAISNANNASFLTALAESGMDLAVLGQIGAAMAMGSSSKPAAKAAPAAPAVADTSNDDPDIG